MSSNVKSDEWTVGKLLEWTNEFFHKQDFETPRLDAEVLLAHVLSCGRIDLYTDYQAAVNEPDRARFRELVKQRAEGCPAAYLTGWKEFYALRLSVTRDVLIPRPETEHVVIAALDHARDHQLDRLLDLGTGSGAIVIAILRELRDCTAVAADVSQAALDVAKSNAQAHGVADRVRFVASDLFTNVEKEEFDVVVSNPPYISDSDYDALPKTVRDYEPTTALRAGSRGTEVIERIIGGAADYLRPQGKLFIEFGAGQGERIRGFCPEVQWRVLPTVKDMSGLERVFAAERR